MFNKRLEKRIKELEVWIENTADVQRQLLEELGYELRWVYQRPYKLKIVKIDKEEDI